MLVVTTDMQQPKGVLHRFEKVSGTWQKRGEPFYVNLGRNGLGWGTGSFIPEHPENDPIKQEGDGRAPAGVFTLGTAFGTAASFRSNLPYLQATDDLLCVDDSAAKSYNRILPVAEAGPIRSFEWMRRSDGLYRYGIVVEHNQRQTPRGGSCIFLHIQAGNDAPTSGCTSMRAEQLTALMRWLDPEKSPLFIQIPAEALPGIRQRYSLP